MNPRKTTPSDAEVSDIAMVDPGAVALLDYGGAAAHPYRLLALRLEDLARRGIRRVLFTSALAGEGRTTVAANTAVALAAMGSLRVALVDGHLRNPGVHRFLGLDIQSGLGDVLAERVAVDEVLWQLDSARLAVVPAAPLDAAHGPALTATGAAAQRALDALGARFEMVLIDGPPLLTSADAAWLTRHVDGTVLVVRARKTARRLVELAAGEIDAATLLGSVVTDVSPIAGGAYGGLLVAPMRASRGIAAPPGPSLLGPRRAA